jgi:transposase
MMPMRVAPRVDLTDEQRTTLQRWSRGRTTPARLVRRAQIVLLAAGGKDNLAIAAELGVERTIVGRWRRRFVAKGLPGIAKDAPRGGRPATKRQQVARRIIEYTTQRKPAGATHWSTNSLARELGVSPSMVARVWRANGLKPHRMRTFKVSNDPRFVEKMTDIVG